VDPQYGPPFAEFRFFYRSREVLIAKGIIEMPSAEVKIENDTPSKKRKAKGFNPRKKPAGIPIPTSPKIHTPVRHRAKKIKSTPKTQIKEEFTSSPLRESHSDPPTPTPNGLPRATPLSNPGVLTWVQSQTPADTDNTSMLREIRELRVHPTSQLIVGRS
jgi:hypothetical protein